MIRAKPPIPDAALDCFVEGAGVLTLSGKPAGYIVTHLTWFLSPGSMRQKQWWVWYIVIWADGSREHPEEDYPPWLTVTELNSGYFDFVGRKSREQRYDFEWLSKEDAKALRERLEITEGDF